MARGGLFPDGDDGRRAEVGSIAGTTDAFGQVDACRKVVVLLVLRHNLGERIVSILHKERRARIPAGSTAHALHPVDCYLHGISLFFLCACGHTGIIRLVEVTKDARVQAKKGTQMPATGIRAGRDRSRFFVRIRGRIRFFLRVLVPAHLLFFPFERLGVNVPFGPAQ